MKRNLAVAAAGLGLAATLAMGPSHAQPAPASKGPVIYSAIDQVTYKEIAPGISKAVLWGDPDKGPYGAFTKMVPGASAGTHIHSNDIWIVVLRGSYVFKDAAGEKWVGPGGFIRIPARYRHTSGADPTELTIFYEESPGRFDLLKVK